MKRAARVKLQPLFFGASQTTLKAVQVFSKQRVGVVCLSWDSKEGQDDILR